MPSFSCTRARLRTPTLVVLGALGALGPLGAGLASGRASAQSDAAGASVRFTVEGCPALSPERLRAILGIELGALLIDAAEDAPMPAIEALVACEGIVATLTVRDPATGATLARHVELDVVHPAARERFVALTIAELVTALGIELEPTGEQGDPASDPESAPEAEVVPDAPPDGPTPHATSAPARQLRLAALGTAAVLGHPRRGAFGARVRFDHRVHGPFGWAASLAVERGHAATTLGDVSHVVLTLGLDATLHADLGALTLQGALGLRLGAASFRGDATDPAVSQHVFRAPLLAPALAVRALIRPGARVFVVVGAELSVYAVSAHALVDRARAVNVQGASFGAELGVGVEL